MTEPLILVPARGGSVGVPRKACRFLAGKPLLWWTLDTVDPLGRVVVCTDDDEIALLAQRKGVEVFRDRQTADGTRTIDHVVWDAMQLYPNHDVIATVQPTSPFLKASTVERCLRQAEKGTSAITVTRDGHVRFSDSMLITPWTTRQQNANWRLTGGCIAAPRQNVSAERRWGMPYKLIPVQGQEALDIDEPADWALAHHFASQVSVGYRVDGGQNLGLGHVYRAATLLQSPAVGEAILYMDAEHYPEGVGLAQQLGLTVADPSELRGHDILVVENRPMDLRGHAELTVCVEDRTEQADLADLIFNDLDGPSQDGPRIYQGASYAVVRDEFLTVDPVPLVDEVDSIVLTFGGSDPADLTRKTLRALEGVKRPLTLTVILGPSYPRHRELPLRSHHQIHVVHSPALLSRYFEIADLAITSCGRTVYELVACQVPTLALPQNVHELRHASLSYDCGVWAVPQLGMELHDTTMSALVTQAMDKSWRVHARSRMAQIDVRHGVERFWGIVLGAVKQRSMRRIAA